MTRTAQKIHTLLREDEAYEEALDSIRERADENGGEIEWSDVRDDLTSGQWGRIIEKGILVDGDDGFEIADREGYDTALDGDGDDEPLGGVEIDPEGSKWSQWDKLAAVASVLFMVGYWFDSVRDGIGGAIDIVLGPLDAMLPFYVVILAVALLTGLYSALLQANLMNPDRMAKYQKRMKAMQEKQKEVKQRKREAEESGAPEAELKRLENEVERVQEEQMEAMTENIGMFKEQFRPMVWIMLLTIPLFLWMYWKIHAGELSGAEQYMVMPIAGEVELSNRVRGFFPTWIVWYFVCSMGFGQLLRKALNINMSPTTA